MSPPLLVALTVVLAGAALRPRSPARRLDREHTAAGDPSMPVRSTPPARWPAARWRGRPIAPRRAERCDPAELAAWCDALSRAVRGGTTLRHALATVPVPPGVSVTFEPVVHALDRGASMASALDTVALPPPHVDVVLVVLRACARHGGAPAEPLDRCAAALRQRAALIAERSTQSAQARMSAAVMTLLPGALLAVLLATSPPVRGAVTSTVGAIVVATGAAVNATGWWWMRRIIAGRSPWG